MLVEIVNVGDGACTIISCSDHAGAGRGITMIDCGVRRGGGGARGAASKALRALAGGRQHGTRLSELETIVVTHFDWDHWAGFRHIADAYGKLPASGRPIQLFYPGLPGGWGPRLAAGIVALISTRERVPVNAMHLIREWEAAAPGHINARPLWRGSTFRSNNHEWRVLWPPKRLGGPLEARVDAWLTELAKLADDMAEAGRPKLRDDLEAAYRHFDQVPQHDDESADLEPVHIDIDTDTDLEAHHFDDDGASEDAVDDDSWPDEADFKDRVKRLAAKMSGLDNLLSLVVEDRYGEFITFGDVEGDALKMLVSTRRLRPHYRLMLAPHHGTHAVPGGFPGACICVAQNGTEHAARHGLHSGSHGRSTGLCAQTADGGDVLTFDTRLECGFWT